MHDRHKRRPSDFINITIRQDIYMNGCSFPIHEIDRIEFYGWIDGY